MRMDPTLVAIVVILVTLLVFVYHKIKTMDDIDRIVLEANLWLPIGTFYAITGQMDKMRPKRNYNVTDKNGNTIPVPCRAWVVTSKEAYSFKVRESDIFIATYPKAGTTWMQEITWLICNNADTNTSKKIQLDHRVPFLEFVDPPCHYPIGIKTLESSPKNKERIIKTHLPFEFLPKEFQEERKCKLIYVARNAKDVCVSFYHFLRINPGTTAPKSWTDFFSKYCSGDVPYGSWFNHVLKYWEKYNEVGGKKYIYFTTYEALTKDLRGEIANISNFLGKKLTDEQMDIIAENCTMATMERNRSTSNLHLVDSKKGKFMRKGKVGDWKNHFTLNQNEAFDEMYQEKMKNSDFHIPFEIE